jgi:dehydrogenase/reductase SDR family member 7B
MKELLALDRKASKKVGNDVNDLPKRQQSAITARLFPKGYFKDKVIIITGASSGIGKALAMQFSAAGGKIVLAARNLNRLQDVAKNIKTNGGKAIIVPTDVTNHRDCYHLIDKTLEVYGGIDIMLNNAGISMRAGFVEVNIDVLKRVMNTNFWGTVYCTKYALPHLLESKGSLVAISSICGITPLPGRTGYAASKHAISGFMDTIRLEHLTNSLHVLTVHAGFTASNIRNVALNQYGEEQKESPRNEDKMMSAEAVAKAVVKAIKLKKRDIILSRNGKFIIWLYKRLPRIADRLIYNEMEKEAGAPF